MTETARTRLRHKRDGMIVDLWMPANAITYGRVMSALGGMGFELRREDNNESAVVTTDPPQRGPIRDTGDTQP